MNDGPRYVTLRDYLRVVRRNRWLVAAIVVAFTGVAMAISLTQAERYEARASLSFRDIGSDLNLLGASAPPQVSPEERAAATAQLINRPVIARRASRRLRAGVSPDQIRSDVSAEVGGISNIVNVVARSSEPLFAARLANAVAAEASRLARREEARRIDRAIASLEREAAADPGGVGSAIVREQIVQLETVKRIARPVKVAQRAQVPAGPVSPKPVRSTLLGALLGLAIGLLAAFARDSLDRRLRGTSDVHEELGMPVLAKVPERVMGGAGFVQNGRPPAADIDLETFRVLRTNLDFLGEDRRVKTILVTSGLAEEGKSTVAAGLASAAAVGGRETVLIECDLRRPSLADRLGIKRTPGLSDYLQGRATPQEVVQPVSTGPAFSSNGNTPSAGRDAGKLVAITAGTHIPRPAELLGTEKFREFIVQVTEVYDLVVIDTSPVLSVVDALELVPQVDGVIVCARLSKTTRDEARAVRAALDRLPPRVMGAVVTGVRPDDEDAYQYYYAYGR